MKGTVGLIPHSQPLLTAVVTAAALLVGCAEPSEPLGAATTIPGTTARSVPTPSAGATNPTPAGLLEFSPTPGYQLLLAATDIAAEQTRFPFVVIGPEGAFVEDADISVTFFLVDEDTGAPGPAQEHRSTYRSLETELPHIHEDGSTHLHQDSQGIYIVDAVDFASPGIWGVRATAAAGGRSGAAIDLQIAVRVAERALTPAIGDSAPRAEQTTARDVESLSAISTAEPPVPALYEKTVAEALDQARPFVLVFSTPAYCQSRVCGPVLDEVIEVMPHFQAQVEFVHIEPFDVEAIRTGGGFTLVPAAAQWGLPSEPWVFVVDAGGRIASKFEGIVTAPELRRAIQAVRDR